MLGYRKRSFAQAHALLENLRANANDSASLRSLQVLLLGEIMRTERKIRELKTQLKGVQSGGGRGAAKRSSYLRNRIERTRDVAYVWRCFGDAIAFLYLDKYALKQMYFNVANLNPKGAAGFLSDKEGIEHEIQLVELALQRNVPALLTDLTNTLRHGDVCLLGGPDPVLIEVKASRNLDRRGKRQRRAIEKLQNFFESDQAKDLRGFSNVRRVAFETPEKTYTEELNACVSKARNETFAVCEPETGLAYIVLTPDGPTLDVAMNSIAFKPGWIFSLNEFKLHRNWSPYLPFTLSLRSNNDLWDFIRGDLYIVVAIDPEAFCHAASAQGFNAELNAHDENYPLQITARGVEGPIRISGQMLARAAFEFVSPNWLIAASIEVAKQGYSGLNMAGR